MDIDLNDYIAGGYLIVKGVERPEYMSPDLIPARIISLSRCICPNVQSYLGWDIEGHRQEVLDWGIPEHKLAEFADWSRGFVVDPDVFVTLDAARWFIVEFLPDTGHVALLGIGLHRALVDDFLATCQQVVFDAHRQTYLGDAKYGVNWMLDRRQVLAAGGEILGFEVVGYQNSLSCSWLCSGLEREMRQLFGIRPNAHGLIDSFEEARQVYEWIGEDEQKGTRAEPIPYYPWLIVRYPLSSESKTPDC